jgi:hypothetical protein
MSAQACMADIYGPKFVKGVFDPLLGPVHRLQPGLLIRLPRTLATAMRGRDAGAGNCGDSALN